MGKSQRDKGKRGERELAKKLQALDPEARRSFGQSRSGADAPDIIIDYDPPLWIECKVGKRPPTAKALQQAIDALDEAVSRGTWPDSAIPIACTRVDRQRTWYAHLILEDLVSLVGAANLMVSVDLDELLALLKPRKS